MRLHSLTVSGFGPFAGREYVDFDQLSSEGLFLFCGQTGAGKTSILDAVAFALYGTLPGSRATMRNRLRSDHALMTTPTYVELVCTLGADTVRIHRSPEYQRPKKSGSGTTLQKHKVSLERRESDGTWVAVSDRADAVGDFVLDRLGLNADQFFQVVLLPQGAFAQFLLADDNAREEVLRSLFNARRFSDVEDWFAQRRNQQRADVAIVKTRLEEFVTRASQVAGIADDERPAYRPQGWFDTLVEEASDRAEQATAQAKRIDRAASKAEKAATAARELAAKQTRMSAALAADTRVQSRRAAFDQLRATVLAADRARPVVPLIEAVTDAAATERLAIAATASAREAMSRQVAGAADYDRSALRRWARSCDQLRGTLSRALADEVALRGLTDIVVTQRELLERAEATFAGLLAERQQLPDSIAALRERLADSHAAASGLDDAQICLDKLQGALVAAELAEQLAEQVLIAQDRVWSAVDTAQSAKTAWLDIRERRIEGMAAELAAVLADGQGCPVCGALEHPAPAQSGRDAPSATDERASQKRTDTAESARELRVAELSSLRAQLGAAQASAGEQSGPAIVAAIVEQKERIASINVAAGQAIALRTDLARQLERQDGLDAQIDQVREGRERLRQVQAGQQVKVDTLADQVRVARDDFVSVELRVAALDQQIRCGRHLLEVMDEQTVASRSFAKAEVAAGAEADRAGFASVIEASAASLSPDQLAQSSAQVKQFDSAAEVCQAILASPDLQDLPSDPAPVDQTAEIYEQVREASLAAHAVQKQALTDKDQLIKISTAARGVLEQAAPALAALEEIEQLAGLIRGEAGNNHRMRLTSYVLAARLEQVAEAASERLEIMSKGRYRLEHTDTRLNRRGTGGLGLLVIDSHTGRSRPTRTLSGGESFLASLALALGLAEVVTAEAGATTLESLFVDEGFGSLDADTLDVVMSTLDDLRAGGRAIGLISHVEDLKSRIQAKLYLSRTPSGSHIHEQPGDQYELMDPLVRGIA